MFFVFLLLYTHWFLVQIYIYVLLYIIIYIMYIIYMYNISTHICNYENNVPSPLSLQWFCGNSCTQTVHHVPKCMSCHKATVVITGGILFSWLHIYHAHLVSVRFEHSVCCELLMTTYIYIYFISLIYSIRMKRKLSTGKKV